MNCRHCSQTASTRRSIKRQRMLPSAQLEIILGPISGRAFRPKWSRGMGLINDRPLAQYPYYSTVLRPAGATRLQLYLPARRHFHRPTVVPASRTYRLCNEQKVMTLRTTGEGVRWLWACQQRVRRSVRRTVTASALP